MISFLCEGGDEIVDKFGKEIQIFDDEFKDNGDEILRTVMKIKDDDDNKAN